MQFNSDKLTPETVNIINQNFKSIEAYVQQQFSIERSRKSDSSDDLRQMYKDLVTLATVKNCL